MESDASYFGRRVREELLAALKADHPRARRAHLDLAARYDDLARAIELKGRRSGTERAIEPATDPAQKPERIGLWV